jgi:hypothetical protein
MCLCVCMPCAHTLRPAYDAGEGVAAGGFVSLTEELFPPLFDFFFPLSFSPPAQTLARPLCVLGFWEGVAWSRLPLRPRIPPFWGARGLETGGQRRPPPTPGPLAAAGGAQ